MNERTPLSEQRLDELLESPAQQTLVQCVRMLEEDTVSLEWRSRLNEKILTLEPKLVRGWSWGFRGALVGAAAMAFALWMNMPKDAEPAPASKKVVAEANLISAHSAQVTFSEIAGPGLSDSEAMRTTSTESDINSWSEADLDTL